MHLSTVAGYNMRLWPDEFHAICLSLKDDSARKKTASNSWTRFDGLRDFGALDAQAGRHGG